MEIKKLSEILYSENPTINFKATVLEMQSEGDGEKKPFKVTLKLEESGEIVNVSSWNFDQLDTYKDAVTTDLVYDIEGRAGIFGNYGEQIRVGNIKCLHMRSTRKIIKKVDMSAVKDEINSLIKLYIPKTSVYHAIITKLLVENDKFWIWPAATKVHHNYEGGLAKHSLNVCKNAINIWENYEGSNMSIQTIVAAALLHDIGKIEEYNKDGSRTKYGDLIPHPVGGYGKIINIAKDLGLDPLKNTEIVMLSHCILSHHEKLEFGAACQPNILEATVVAKADALDAAVEASDKTLDNLSLNESSDRLLALDNARVFKWHS